MCLWPIKQSHPGLESSFSQQGDLVRSEQWDVGPKGFIFFKIKRLVGCRTNGIFFGKLRGRTDDMDPFLEFTQDVFADDINVFRPELSHSTHTHIYIYIYI